MAIETLNIWNEDALGNQFDVVIPAFPGVIDLVNTNIRVTTISIPENSQGEYIVDYKTESFPKPNGKLTYPKEFSFTFRIDLNYQVYKGFMAWRNSILDSATGIATPDFVNGTSANRVPIQVLATDTSNNVLAEWTMQGCYPSSIGGVDFDVASGDPLLCTVTMKCSKIIFPVA